MMEITPEQYERIEHCFPKPRGKLRYHHLSILNATLYIAEKVLHQLAWEMGWKRVSGEDGKH